VTSGFHLAQVNVGRIRAPLDSPKLKDFVNLLDPINALADGSPGFVWRLQSEDGNATSIRVFEDDRLLLNMSVWESVEALGAFAYETSHLDVLRRRREWFEVMTDAYLALWWIPAGSLPTLNDAKIRIEHIRKHGPTAYAFTLKTHFAPPGSSHSAVEEDRWPCPVG
jgi:uncharacterized protein DUF3291